MVHHKDEVHIICACAYLLNNHIRDIDYPNMLDLLSRIVDIQSEKEEEGIRILFVY